MPWQLIEWNKIKYFGFGFQNIKVLYSTRFGNDEILKKFKPVFLFQIHSDIIIDIDNCKERIGDGMITGKSNLAIGIKVADCLPVYLFSEKKCCIIHCGWRGIIKGIARRAARIMKKYSYCLGAAIGPGCYEIKKDVVNQFKNRYQNGIIYKNGRYFLNLKQCVIQDLGKENLIGCLDFCTKCHPEYFYSYRLGDKKRNYAIMYRSNKTL